MTTDFSQPVSLFIADDHLLFSDALELALHNATEIDVKVLYKAADGEALLAYLQHTQPDIILLDLNMPVKNGLEAIPEIRQQFPDVRIIMVTQYSDPKFVRECLQVYQVEGYILKSSPLSELITCITQVFNGQSYFSKGLQIYPKDSEQESDQGMFQENFSIRYILTKRELEILGLVAQARSNAQIAQVLFISPQTVGAHRKNIMRKLNISTTAGLVRFAIENQLG